jgi:hypothetical protein
MHTRTRAAALTLLIGATLACSREPVPHETGMVARFEEHRETFAEIAQWAGERPGPMDLRLDPTGEDAPEGGDLTKEDAERLRKWAAALQIRGLRREHYDSPDEIQLEIWAFDVIGPGGYWLWYVHSEEEPTPLVDSIEPFIHPTLREGPHGYRALADGWYIQYLSG